jgi:hypothetical protein
MVRQVTKGPISAAGSEKFFRELFEASRDEAPEEMIFQLRDAASSGLRTGRSKAGRSQDHSKKGRGTSVGFDFRVRPDGAKQKRGFGWRTGVEVVRLLPWRELPVESDA